MNPPVSLQPRPYLLVNKIQHYAWGSRGQDAFIPRLLGIAAEPNLPYAELWIGTHPKAPSEMVVDGVSVSLSRVISQYPLQILGNRVSKRFSGSLPFLFKVLSVAEPLSIQAHPNREQAQALNSRDPEHYPADNHKPELALALDSLTALVGFRSLGDIHRSLERYPELAHFIGLDIYHRLKESQTLTGLEQQNLTRLVYRGLIQRSRTCEKELIECIGQVEDRLHRSSNNLRDEERLFLDLRGKHAGADVGLLSVFLLSPIQLEEGQGVLIEPGVPHAYLKGNIVECMANSDNVVRAGLTPKFKDFETMVDVLSYGTDPVSILGDDADREHVIYQTPVAEFQVSRWRLKRGKTITEVTRGEPGILLIIKGDIRLRWQANSESVQLDFQQGQSILIPASLGEFKMTSLSSVEVFKVEVPR